MTLLKQCMAWVTVLKRTPSQTFQNIHWRLLLAYMMAMTAIVGISAVTVYIFSTKVVINSYTVNS